VRARAGRRTECHNTLPIAGADEVVVYVKGGKRKATSEGGKVGVLKKGAVHEREFKLSRRPKVTPVCSGGGSGVGKKGKNPPAAHDNGKLHLNGEMSEKAL